MQRLSFALMFVALVLVLAALAAPAPPEQLVFETKMGNVTYLHAKHVEYAKSDCGVCHDKLFSQSVKAPLGYKGAVHKTAETKKISCGACHNAGGAAFASTGNCKRCHVKK